MGRSYKNIRFFTVATLFSLCVVLIYNVNRLKKVDGVGYKLNNDQDFQYKLAILKRQHDFNLPKLRLSIRILMKALEELEKGDDEVKKVFFKYIGTNQKDFHKFKFQIKSLIEWWLSNDHPLHYDNTKNGAHGNVRDHTISIGNTVLSKPVIQNDRAETSIVATLFHESTHAVLGFSDYSTKTQGNNINVSDVAHDSRHGHYLNPGQCEHLNHLNNQVTLQNPQCWEHAFITEYAYSKMCYTVSEGKYNKKICRYSDTQQIKVAEKWLKGIVAALEKIGQDSVQHPKTYESANFVLEKKFSLVVAGHDDECRPHEKFHGNHKNIVICQSFKSDPKDGDLTEFFFNKIKECNMRGTCHFANHQQIQNIDDLSNDVVYILGRELEGGD